MKIADSVEAARSARLRDLMKKQGLSESHLARKAGLKARTHVGLILKSGAATGKTWQKLADALGVSVDYLLTGVDVRATGADDPYPNRAAAIAARSAVWSYATATILQTYAFALGDQPLAFWLELGDGFQAGKRMNLRVVEEDPVETSKALRKSRS